MSGWAGVWTDEWRRWYRHALPAYWVFLFTSTHLPRLRVPLPTPAADKVLHLAAFGLLAFLFWRCAEAIRRPVSPTFVWFALIVLAAYAAVDEYLQSFVGRSADLADWLANVVGIGAVLGVLEWRRRRSA